MKKVKQFYNKNQFLIEMRNGDLYLQSYESIVAYWDDTHEWLILGTDWNYSRTTLKHLYLFIETLKHKLNEKTYNEIMTSNNKKQTIHKLLKTGQLTIRDL